MIHVQYSTLKPAKGRGLDVDGLMRQYGLLVDYAVDWLRSRKHPVNGMCGQEVGMNMEMEIDPIRDRETVNPEFPEKSRWSYLCFIVAHAAPYPKSPKSTSLDVLLSSLVIGGGSLFWGAISDVFPADPLVSASFASQSRDPRA